MRRFQQSVFQSAAFLLFMLLVGCATDSGRSHSESGHTASPNLVKDARTLGTPFEKDFGYAQAVKIGDTIYVSGQLSVDEKGIINGKDMESQLWQVYANIVKVLGLYGARLKEDVVDEVIYVTDMQAALAVLSKVRAASYAGHPLVASTLVQVAQLSAPGALVEIKVTAKVPALPPEATRPSGRSDSQGQGGGAGGEEGG